MSVVLELLRGADLKATSRKYGVTAATLSEWRGAFLAAGEKGHLLAGGPGRRARLISFDCTVWLLTRERRLDG
jgi:transposase-like protein